MSREFRDARDLPDVAVRPLHFEVVHSAEPLPPIELGEAVLRAFQGAYNHAENEWLAWDFLQNDDARHTPPAPGSHGARSSLRWRRRNATRLYDQFMGLEAEIDHSISSVIKWDAYNPVHVRPLYDVPVIYTALGCSVPAPAQNLETVTYGRPIINTIGYLMPVRGIPQKWDRFASRRMDPQWWVRLLDNATGEAIVKLEFPSSPNSLYR